MLVKVGGLDFIGDDRKALFSISRDALTGWFESVGVRREDVDRPHAHGSYAARGYRSGRVIAMSGLIETGSRAEQRNAIDRLGGILADGGLGLFSVEDDGELTAAEVQLNDAPESRLLVYGRLARYSLEFWAPDPCRYGETRLFQGGTTVVPFHRGNFASDPRVVVESGFDGGFRLEYQGRVFEVARRTYWSERPLEIDMRTGWVWQGESLLRGVIGRGETFSIRPGAQDELRLVGIGAGSGRVSVRVPDTYI